MTVLILEDAAADLEAGRRFYESREQGVGDYFVESLLSDVESLVLLCRDPSSTFRAVSDAVETVSVRDLL
jgi:hypothetical protein